MNKKEAIILQDGKFWKDKSLRRVKYDEMTPEQKAALAKELHLTALPKKPLLLYKDGTKPDGLSVTSAARIIYDEQEFFLTRVQRHVLSSFVFADEKKEIFVRDSWLKSKFVFGERRDGYVFARNAFLTLFDFGTNILNDVWTLQETVHFWDAGRLDRTDETEKTLRTICELTQIRIDAEFFAVEKFSQNTYLPPFLWPQEIQQARDAYCERFPEQLLFNNMNTANAAVWLQEFDLYLTNTFNEQKKF